MATHHGLGMSDSVRSLHIKVENMQKEISAIRKDVQRLLFLLEKQNSPQNETDTDVAER